MNRRLVRVAVLLLCLLAFPRETPAPVIYTPGEGWSYEPVEGGGKWRRNRAKAQVEVAQEAFTAGKYKLAYKAARRTVKVWPLSDYAAQAQYMMGRCREARTQDKLAFEEYQKVLDLYPKVENFDEIIERQFAIANRFLAGQWFKIWGYIPFFASMEKTAAMYGDIIENGPYSEVAPASQMNIGSAKENQSLYSEAVKAYEKAADRYHDRKQVAADARFRAGLAYTKQARTADYDQNVAGQAIATFTDFMALYPDDKRVEQASDLITSLREEQAHGSFRIAQFYEKKKRWDGALVYYNDVLVKNPDSIFADSAKERIDAIRLQVEPTEPGLLEDIAPAEEGLGESQAKTPAPAETE